MMNQTSEGKAAGCWRSAVAFGNVCFTQQTALQQRRGSVAIHFCKFCFPSAQESGEGQRHAALFHSVPHNCPPLLSIFSLGLQNSPSLPLCSEYGPCCFKISWTHLSLMELHGSSGSAKLGLKMVSAGESHLGSLRGEDLLNFTGLCFDRDH